MSAHADRTEILRWLKTMSAPPRQMFLVHGEPPRLAALKERIQGELSLTPHVPTHGEATDL
jgi:metallo-beta-lactamase family protein